MSDKRAALVPDAAIGGLLGGLAKNTLKGLLERQLRDKLKGIDPRTAPVGTEIRVKPGVDFDAYGRDVDVEIVFKLGAFKNAGKKL